MATIFIVDDDQAIGEMLSLVLENEGFQTVTCLDGLRAVEMFPIVKPDLILLDVMLPGLDGTEVARRIRATSNVPIIMLTAKSDTLDVVAGLEAGADDYVPKPFKVAELLARIRARFRIAKPAAEDGLDRVHRKHRLCQEHCGRWLGARRRCLRGHRRYDHHRWLRLRARLRARLSGPLHPRSAHL